MYCNILCVVFRSEPIQASVAADTLHQSKLPVKRERRNSASSQHSTNSNLSQASQSSRHKRAKSNAFNSTNAAEALTTPAHPDLKQSSTPVTTPSTLSQEKSSSASSNKYTGVSIDYQYWW